MTYHDFPTRSVHCFSDWVAQTLCGRLLRMYAGLSPCMFSHGNGQRGSTAGHLSISPQVTNPLKRRFKTQPICSKAMETLTAGYWLHLDLCICKTPHGWRPQFCSSWAANHESGSKAANRNLVPSSLLTLYVILLIITIKIPICVFSDSKRIYPSLPINFLLVFVGGQGAPSTKILGSAYIPSVVRVWPPGFAQELG